MTQTKTLMLLRHAHSGAAAAPFGPDHDRVLTRRGVGACRGIATWLQGAGFTPEMVHCSTAARARETWDRIASHMHLENGGKTSVMYTRDLYLAPPQTIMRQLANTSADVSTALCVAHNPGIGDLALHLAMRNPGTEMADMAIKYPTAALAIYRFKGTWASLAEAGAQASMDTDLVHYIVPKRLPTAP